MKTAVHISLAILVNCTIIQSKSAQTNDCTISIESQWEDLENNKEKSQKFGGKWILAGTITFKKKCNKQVTLQEIRLQWHGKHLELLTGSLFIHKDTGPFKPVPDNHIADSKWSKTTQTLLLKFNHPISLHTTTTFHLVLTVPEDQEQLLKGNFTIEPAYLPEPFQEAIQKDPLSISLDVMGSSVH